MGRLIFGGGLVRRERDWDEIIVDWADIPCDGDYIIDDCADIAGLDDITSDRDDINSISANNKEISYSPI